MQDVGTWLLIAMLHRQGLYDAARASWADEKMHGPLRIALDADEAASRVESRNAGGAAAHAVVKHRVTGVGVSADEVLHQRQRLLSWVLVLPASIEVLHGRWELNVPVPL